MKNKITKLFLALLALTASNNLHAQDQPMPDYVRNATNIEFLTQFAKEKSLEYETNYNKAVEMARAQNMPISGYNEGRYFSLVGYDQETGKLKYYTTTNNSATKSSLQTANAKSLHANGITGAGMKVGVWDGGVGLPNHLAFSGGRYIVKDNNTGTIEHAAHVAGTVAGGLWTDATTLGFSYDSQVYAYNWGNDTAEMTAAATAQVNPIYVSNHSYGLDFAGSGAPVSIFGQYNAQSRDADLLANNAPYYTMVHSAGNDRNNNFNPGKIAGKDLLSNEKTAKNVVVVAATQGTDDYAGITGVASVTSVGGVPPFISSFSNYGPTDDFRIKPDISAKGVGVKSISNTSVSSVETLDGTSMAAPAVTGVFNLWQGYHNQIFTKYMRSASVRALMAHTARETGPAAGPDFMFGWGLIDAAKGVEIMDEALAGTSLFKEFEITQGTGFEYSFPYNAAEPLVVTIAWNDPAGTVTSQADLDLKKLVNDLDLRLVNTDTNQTYYPWSLTRSWSVAPTSSQIAVRNVDNIRDNIEKIEPQNAIAGNYKIIVTHKGTLQGGRQAYSLIVSGAGGIMPVTDGAVSVENQVLNNLTIYPNPVDTNLTISGDLASIGAANVQIFDLAGKKVKDLNLEFTNSNNTSIDVSSLNSGAYILSIEKNNAKQSYKFIKK
ncbi:S8 family peptidase [Myroides sp. JBRI-B21084]|uniref:S8/S53 family peptidase n=1 Tax=Myroides sp. JBRI-B21084 TaxID=3119977 RepID=UPI0026E1FAB4|nr:S8/S53 family peptidase [Paenimyroides cloacae]WKW46320.1 S8 family peptidase [Paenimyroides cloacae]